MGIGFGRLGVSLMLLAVLAGCASPRARCVAEATGELRVIDRLIAETEANIARGYALARAPGVRARLTACAAWDEPFLFCVHDAPVVVQRPVAIDRAEERRKLASLRERRAELEAGMRARLAACAGLPA